MYQKSKASNTSTHFLMVSGINVQTYGGIRQFATNTTCHKHTFH